MSIQQLKSWDWSSMLGTPTIATLILASDQIKVASIFMEKMFMITIEMILFIESSKEELLRNLTCSTVRRKMNHQKIQLFKHKLHIWLEKWLELRKLYKILSKIILFILENLIHQQAYDVWFFFHFTMCADVFFDVLTNFSLLQ